MTDIRLVQIPRSLPARWPLTDAHVHQHRRSACVHRPADRRRLCRSCSARCWSRLSPAPPTAWSRPCACSSMSRASARATCCPTTARPSPSRPRPLSASCSPWASWSCSIPSWSASCSGGSPGRLPGRHHPLGQLLAVFMSNAGGAWDNAKKLVEEGLLWRQGLRGPQGERGRRHRRRPAEGHRRPGPEPADQGHQPDQPDHRPHRGPDQRPTLCCSGSSCWS